MKRRDFMKGSILAVGGSLLPVRWAGAHPSEKLKVGYIRENIPAIEIPPYRGERYEDRVPDTLEIAERARLGVNVLTSVADPQVDDEIFESAHFGSNPATLEHNCGDWLQICEGCQEALPLMRLASGSSQNEQVDPVWMTTFLKEIGPDGLVYVPMEGRPWMRATQPTYCDPIWTPEGSRTQKADKSVTQFTNGSYCARSFSTMMVYYLRDKNPMWKEAGERMTNRLRELAVDKGDYAYLPVGSFEPNAKIGPGAEMPPGPSAGDLWDMRPIQGLAQYYKVTGYEPAVEFAGKLARFFRNHAAYYAPDGAFIDAPDKPGGHAHTHALGLLSMLEYATAVNDREFMEFVSASYNWAKSQNSAYQVSSLVGWFPEVYEPNHLNGEACTIGDMIGIAVKLTEAGVGDYWDDVDRWVRNQFAEQQLNDAIVGPLRRFIANAPRKPVAWNQTADRVIERTIGGFNYCPGANNWATPELAAVEHCCTGNCTRAIYYVWEYMVEHKGDELRVNLLLNRASQWADVHSYVPYEGRVDVKMKKACGKVVVRAPEWVKSGSPEMKCEVSGVSRKLHWEGRYVSVGAGNAGERISVRFPIAERTASERIGRVTYKLVLKGNTVVSMDPPGEYVPLYQDRAKYRKEVRWRKAERFVPSEEILW